MKQTMMIKKTDDAYIIHILLSFKFNFLLDHFISHSSHEPELAGSFHISSIVCSGAVRSGRVAGGLLTLYAGCPDCHPTRIVKPLNRTQSIHPSQEKSLASLTLPTPITGLPRQRHCTLHASNLLNDFVSKKLTNITTTSKHFH